MTEWLERPIILKELRNRSKLYDELYLKNSLIIHEENTKEMNV
jgi:hypothetical protein